MLISIISSASWTLQPCSCVTWLTERCVPKSEASEELPRIRVIRPQCYTDGRMAFLSCRFTSTLTRHIRLTGDGGQGAPATHRRLVPSLRPVKTEEIVRHRQNLATTCGDLAGEKQLVYSATCSFNSYAAEQSQRQSPKEQGCWGTVTESEGTRLLRNSHRVRRNKAVEEQLSNMTIHPALRAWQLHLLALDLTWALGDGRELMWTATSV